MKKLFFMAVAAIAALSSCTSDNELELNQNTGKEALTFTATMEDSEATRATLGTDEDGKNYALWEAGDQISINGKSYTAQEGAGAKATFKADGEGAEGTTYEAYFPADLIDGTTATLPAIQTYTAGKFNMPMYAESTTTELAFKNLCAVLAIKVTSADISTLKSIKVASDKVMNGTFTVTDKKAVMGTDGTNAVVLESSEALTLDETGTTFYIAIPAQTYQYLNIFLSADGETYTQAMATKKATGLGAIARNTIFNIDYAKNATKLWAGNLLIADCNVGATSPEAYGGYYSWGGSQNKVVNDCYTGPEDLSPTSDPITDTATKLWGSNWRMMTKVELETLKDLGALDGTNKGLQCTSTTYTGNSIFLPAAGYCYDGDVYDQNDQGYYWASSFGENGWEGSTGFALSYHVIYDDLRVDKYSIYQGYSVRAVLEEAASPAPAAPATTGKATIAGGGFDVNWVQLWENGPKFAEYNVGATSENDCGGYYTWGGKYNNGEDDWDDDHNTGTDNLSPTSDPITDTATKLWGSNWRMPTQAELQGLLDNCTVEWTDNYNSTDIAGRIFTGKDAYSSNSIFLPAAGRCYNGGVNAQGDVGSYWSSTPYDSGRAYYLNFSSGSQGVYNFNRNFGSSVRAVLNESAE